MATARENELRVAHWNVRTLRKTKSTVDMKKLKRLEEFMTRESIDILGISETHIFKSSSSNNVWSSSMSGQSRYHLYLSNVDPMGPQQNELEVDRLLRIQANKRLGVGMLVRNELMDRLENVKSPDPSRIIAFLLTRADRNVLIIEAYAPTELSNRNRDHPISEELKTVKKLVKDKFYKDLDSTIHEGMQIGATILLLGDFNARTGSDPGSEWEAIIGPYSMIEDPERKTKIPSFPSDNGVRLIEMCLKYNLRIINNLFQQENTNKWTWRSPQKTTARIDFIVTTRDESEVVVKSFSIEPEEKKFSDHRSIWAVLEFGGVRCQRTPFEKQRDIQQRSQFKEYHVFQQVLSKLYQPAEEQNDNDLEPVDMPFSDDEEDEEEEVEGFSWPVSWNQN